MSLMRGTIKLTREGFARARAHLVEHGRPLEQGLFRWCFENGSARDVLRALAAHQASNGGFCGMGEGPITSPSPIGTSVAFQHLTDLGAPCEHRLVQGGIRYLIDTYDHEHAAWPQEIPDDGYLVHDLPLHWGNPSAEIVGYLWRHRHWVPADFLGQVTDAAMANLRRIGHELPPFADLCFLRCAESIDEPHRGEIIQRLVGGTARRNVQRDYARWETGYFVKPYWYARTPASPLYPVLRDEIERCLDFDIRTQEPDGSARLTFQVHGDARRIWKSVWTLESLRILKAYDRIEGEQAC
jgi:hypothetical protein